MKNVSLGIAVEIYLLSIKELLMDKSYQKFLRLGISLAPVGIETRDEEEKYFCTPKGASIMGWEGVDGIHYCRIRSFGNMIFAVSPMNTAPDYVHPIAEDFEALLRLLLACGDAALLEQAWNWSEEQFHAYLAEYPPTKEQKAVLSEIGEKMKLLPMGSPWQYLHSLQENFDYSKIKYTDDLADSEMNADAKANVPKWKVFFDGSFWGRQGRTHAGTEICIDKQFEWAGRHWLIPTAYSCSKGLVIDFGMRVEVKEICAFMKKWKLDQENDSYEYFTQEQQMELELENPLRMDFNPQLEMNGQKMRFSHGCAVSFNPCLPEGMVNELEAKWVVDHYDLDTSYGWVIYREAFLWKNKRRPEIKTLSLTMEQQPVQIPGPHFKTHAPGNSFKFIHPVSKREYTLTVQELEKQTMPENRFGSERWVYPTHFTVMSYTLSPETKEKITISDCEDGDKPIERIISEGPFAPAASASAACIGIIGGADGPTAIVFGGSTEGKLCVACSALHFEPVRHDIEWRIIFYEKRFDDYTLTLI